MRRVAKVAVGAAGALALLVGVGWLGLQIKPNPFEPHPEGNNRRARYIRPALRPAGAGLPALPGHAG